MSVATLTWFTIGACIGFVVVQDGNVYEWLVLRSMQIRIGLQRLWFKIRYHPDSPWVRYGIKRNADKLAAEFIKERDNVGN
jgi:hypothetical protein